MSRKSGALAVNTRKQLSPWIFYPTNKDAHCLCCFIQNMICKGCEGVTSGPFRRFTFYNGLSRTSEKVALWGRFELPTP